MKTKSIPAFLSSSDDEVDINVRNVAIEDLCTAPYKATVDFEKSVEGFEKDQAEALIRALAKRFGADQAVWDVARLLRLPGFQNHKYRELRHFVEDIQENPLEVMA